MLMPRELKPCGTEAAYRRHLLRGEKACTECRAGHARAEARRTVGRRARWRGALATFWARVALPDENGCMVWQGTKNPLGYGQTSVDGKRGSAHRVSLLIAEGPPPDEVRIYAAHAPVVCHRPDCVAPLHLRWATHAENMADRWIDGTMNIGSRNGAARLTARDVQAIRRRYAAGGETHRSLAAEFGVSSASISDLLNGHTWRHVGEAS